MENLKTSKENRAVIVADAHLPLDDRNGGNAERLAFLELLRHHREDSSLLVLLGDVFDFWYEWRHVVPKRAFAILDELKNWTTLGIPVHYFAGNHDFRVAGFLEDEIGLIVHMNEWRTVIDDKRYFFHHGDGFAASDVGYRRMKSVFRSRVAQFLFGTIVHPDLAMGFGKSASDLGRKKRDTNTRVIPSPEEYHDHAERIAVKGHDVVVIGHTHIADTIELEHGWYHNPGSFMDDRRYSVIEGGLPRPEIWS